MKIKTNEATLVQLDYLVAKHLGLRVLPVTAPDRASGIRVADLVQVDWRRETFYYFTPTLNWAQGGPLIEKYQIMFESAGVAGVVAYFKAWGTAGPTATGPSHLIAAVRLIVEGSFLEVVEIPEELA